MRKRLAVILVLLGAFLGIYAQTETDSIVVEPDVLLDSIVAELDTMQPNLSLALPDTTVTLSKKPKRDWTTWKPNPQRALWLALVIPGGGQIYNRKYWKLPIVYGGFLGCIYALTWNNMMYKDYSQAFLDISKDLSLKVQPAVIGNPLIENPIYASSLGVNCKLNF